MKVAIDARFVGTPGGLGRYVEELVSAMVAEAGGDEFVLFLRDAGMGRFADSKVLRRLNAEVRWYGLREQLSMPGIARSAHADLVHWTHWNVPLMTPRPFVVTIHDLIMLDYPSVRSTTLGPAVFAMKNAGFKVVLGNAIKNSAAILVPSGYVKKRVLETWNIDADKVVVTGEGVLALPSGSIESDLKIRESLGVRGEYLFTLGNAYPHKNLDGLLDAFVLLKKDRPDLSLAIAGNDDFFSRRLRTEAGRTGRAQGVVFLSSPDDPAIAALYRGAAAYIAPSFTEGFGLPPLEAMSVGVPVASSGGGSFPEVLGEAAERFNPHRAEDMARVIGRILDDDILRERLAAAGPEQAARWSWKEAAKITLATYRKVLEKKVE